MRVFLSLLLIFVVSSSIAQIRYHSQDKKAIKIFEKGFEEYQAGNDEEAFKYAKSATDRDPKFYEAWDLMSRIYFEQGKKAEALDAIYKMVAIDPAGRPSDYYYIGKLEQELENYPRALEAYNHYIDKRDNDVELLQSAVREAENCEFAIWALENPVPYEPVNLGPAINTKNPEYLPCLTADDNLLLFTRRVHDDRAMEGMQDNLFYATKDELGRWEMAQDLYGINTVFNEGAASISADGKTLVFTACAMYGEYGKGRSGFGSCDLFISKQEKGGWSSPINIGPAINSANWESQPSLSADGSTLYFIRAPKRRNKEANQEIYYSVKLEDGSWKTAEKMPDGINTPYKEETVLIHPDGHTLYFSSNGHPGMGGLDIFMVRKEANGKWGEVKNLGYPINTPNDENSLLVSTDGELAYFSSTMEGGFGSFDLYSFELYPEARPLPVTYMEGKVYDEKTKEVIGVRFELLNLETGELVYHAFSDAEDGKFLIPINYGSSYAFNVEKDSYLFFSEHFELDQSQGDKPFYLDVPLKPIEAGSEVVLRNVFFETDKAELQDESLPELDRLVHLLEQNPSMKIEVEGHTDNEGSKSRNKTLSTDRAKAVYSYLISKGIADSRLKYVGYADERPISTNDTEEGRALNRRTSVLVLEK